MKRRRWLLGGAGAAAALAGVGWQQWRERDVAPGVDAAEAEASASGGGLWRARFDTPDGGTLALASFKGAPLLLNFWATWCPPCIKELPELDRFARDHAAQGLRVVGLAIDSPTPVRKFLASQPVSYPIGLAGFEGTDLSRQLGNTTGGLPFSVLFDRGGQIVQRKLGETHSDELAAWARRV
ncbi:MAG: TlpA disulfide reductase family protein [Rubrivivax sp.]